MRSALAHALRRFARWSIAASNRLAPPIEGTEADFAEWTGVDLGWDSGGQVPEMQAYEMALRPRVTPPMSVTYTGGPEGPAAREMRLRHAASDCGHLTPMPDPHKAAHLREEC